MHRPLSTLHQYGGVSSQYMKGSFVCDGARLCFRDSGAGLPVVFLHPTPLDGRFWRPLAEDLAGMRAIVPDLRGHGASELGSSGPV